MTRKAHGTYTQNKENREEGKWSYLKDPKPPNKKAKRAKKP